MKVYNVIAGRDVGRLATLGDGVFAIALTLLLLDIQLPEAGSVHSEAALWQVLWGLAPRFVTYFLSVLTLGIFWVGHQTQLTYVERSDRNLAWITLVFLAAVALLPFTTRVLGEFIAFRTALWLYWFNILLLGLVALWHWNYAYRAQLMKPGVSTALIRVVRRRVLFAQLLYALGALIGAASPAVGIAFIVLVQLNYAVAPRIAVLFKL